VRTVGELTAMVEQAINDRADSGSASGSV
jgi:hypothetical protein